MRLVINGTERDIPGGATVDQAVDAAGASAARTGVAVAVDGEVVPRGEWERTALAEGQRVEVLQAVQGGS
ncbi:MAG TPA: sulfur carrier protein ThiS [Thermoleophilaceae bacterium]|nr:sulfur carrier protein ThiS [Thermoleophilaceae bacterium]